MEPMSDDYQNEDELPDNQFIIMWDNTGLECIIPFDSFKAGEGGDMLAKLEGGENTNGKEMSRTLFMLKLRAGANTQRHYEIYSLKTSGSITKEELEKMFEDEPQSIVNLIREKGVQIYSNRAPAKPRIL